MKVYTVVCFAIYFYILFVAVCVNANLTNIKNMQMSNSTRVSLNSQIYHVYEKLLPYIICGSEWYTIVNQNVRFLLSQHKPDK